MLLKALGLALIVIGLTRGFAPTNKSPPMEMAATPFPLGKVELLSSSAFYQATQLNLQYLLMLDPDRLLYMFRQTANLSTGSAQPYGGWEAPNCELRGHFVGHYMSATAMMWASTKNEQIKKNMDYLVDELQKCQDKIGTGYLSAYPTSWFDRLESLKGVWAPYYTIHKIMAGLYDQHRIAGNAVALNMAVKMAGYFNKRIQNVFAVNTSARWEQILNNEFGGMNEVLYNLYSETGDKELATMAHLFDKPIFLGPLAVNADLLSGLHANTHIPEVIGAARRYEVLADKTYEDAVRYFLQLVNSTRTYATGGSNSNEHWPEPHRLGDTLGPATEETCTTYNILKVARHLFQWTGSSGLADFYERAIVNGILGVQRPNTPGVSLYMLPLGAGNSKGTGGHSWGTPFDSFWCCYGTAVESFSKLGDSIFFENAQSKTLYVNQYVDTDLQWDTPSILVELRSNFPVPRWGSKHAESAQASLQLVSPSALMIRFNGTIMLRIPLWTAKVDIQINGKPFGGEALPGSYAALTQEWEVGIKVDITFQPKLRLNQILDDRPEFNSLYAILYGPLLLVGMTTGECDLKADISKDVDTWVKPVDYNLELQSLQVFSQPALFLRHSGFQTWANPINVSVGTDGPDSSFMILHPLTNTDDDKSISIQSINYPDFYLAKDNQGDLALLQNDNSNQFKQSATFQMVPGLSNSSGISLEINGDYVSFYKTNKNQFKLQKPVETDITAFAAASTFSLRPGNVKYKLFSFIAHGTNRDYLLEPINAVVDEQYTAYFNITAQ